MLSRQSHQKITAKCSLNISDKCIKQKELEYRTYMDNKDRNNGKYICLYCSRKLKYSGRTNPNCKYDIDDNFFKQINTEAKAYLLGWIISDGNISKSGFRITIHRKDEECLNKLKNIICKNIPIKKEKNNMVSIAINSKEISSDLCKLLEISPGKKSHTVKMPILCNKELQLACIRGVFDGDGSINDPIKNKKNYPTVNISTSSTKLREQIINFINIPTYENNTSNYISWSNNSALDFLDLIYKNATIYLKRKYNLYKIWCQYVPGLGGKTCACSIEGIKCLKTRKDAVLPFKNRASDTGYDLTCIEILKETEDIIYYTTGIKVQMPFGWACDIRPRSSISKTDYVLANSIGTIDRTYLGEIIIALRKTKNNTQKLELPFRIAQLVPYPVVHLDVIEVDELNETERGKSGFGASGR